MVLILMIGPTHAVNATFLGGIVVLDVVVLAFAILVEGGVGSAY